MSEVYLSIQNWEDRKNVAWSLLRSGFRVRIKEEQDKDISTLIYWVIVEVPDNNIKETI